MGSREAWITQSQPGVGDKQLIKKVFLCLEDKVCKSSPTKEIQLIYSSVLLCFSPLFLQAVLLFFAQQSPLQRCNQVKKSPKSHADGFTAM